ncbi:SprT-like domain-containing protein [Bradyrhizobium sp. CCGUVB23]|uniref:SprT-like domain-containing protein n=1 Tax=Bradyrhizobium sp. CCGUVB23 TaxID=2949630 RepID=UPI0020B31581|nr:SprT-like domain-containing protein [Bradyrhizobium sp. CCGUVB23]MCP3460375.1 SprT-like domain-containing protein [Bradyrhizobium sp. CCGUVB23]
MPSLVTLGALAIDAQKRDGDGALSLDHAAATSVSVNPTELTYGTLDFMFHYFDDALFGGQLPHCLLTLQRRRTAAGYFDYRRFAARDGSHRVSEIALNPQCWGPHRTDSDKISTFVHELVHHWQAAYGKPGRGGYHNREWARKMLDIGLVPSSTGEPGGKPTGRRVSHYIREGGPFDLACNALLRTGIQLPYDEVREPLNESAVRRKRSRAASKTSYTCPTCYPPIRAWGRPDLHLICGACHTSFAAEEVDTN